MDSRIDPELRHFMANPELMQQVEAESEKKPKKLGRNPALVECPHCHAKGLTKTEKEGSAAKRIASSTFSVVTSIFTQVPQAYGRRNVIHHCSNCGEEVGRDSGLISSGVGGGAAPVLGA